MDAERIYILGAGSIGMALAVHLSLAGRKVTAVHTSTDDVDAHEVEVTITRDAEKTFTASIETVSLARLKSLTGIVVVTAKSYANELIASRLKGLEISAPLVIMQNGVGVENPYLNLTAARIYRCVLYATGQKNQEQRYTFVPITNSPIGVIRGDEEELAHLISVLNTAEFPFVAHSDIKQEVWKKATINAVFNSICPLLEIDNGIFVRDEKAALLAREVVNECIAIMRGLGVQLSVEEIMEQLFAISRKSSGQLISTLQDINAGRETEIDYLNLEIARLGKTITPEVKANTTRVLGEMVKIKSLLRKELNVVT